MNAGPGRDHDVEEADVLLAEQRRLVSLAYRLLGSLSEAEDAVQEAYARWYAMGPKSREDVVSPAAWLTTVTSRICLDVLGSARRRRESYVGEWVPEPVPDGTDVTAGEVGSTAANPLDRVTLDESVSMAFLVLLESLTPAQRVSFILHDVFHYPFPEIARVVGRTPAACRQLAVSARRRLRSAQVPRTSRSRQAAVVREFRQAWEAKDIRALVGLLDPDATTVADGGGLVSAQLPPIVGATAIAHALVDIANRVPGLFLVERAVNGEPGLVAEQEGETVTVMAFDVVDDAIAHIWAVRNPDKLRHWSSP